MSRASDKLKKDILDIERHFIHHGVPDTVRLKYKEYRMAYETFKGKIEEKKMPLEFNINNLKVICL